MPTLRIYQIDAFSSQVFSGNPAAVCPLEAWPDDGTTQSIAAENNLSETAFFAPEGDGFRLFLPGHGIPEDPVTGSIHCALVPYWARRLGKQQIHARQVSKRGGELFCEDRGDRVIIAGRAVKYMQGTINV